MAESDGREQRPDVSDPENFHGLAAQDLLNDTRTGSAIR